MAKATKKTTTSRQTKDEVLREMFNAEHSRALLAFEPQIHEAVCLAETLSFIAEVPNAPISGNTHAYLVYKLEHSVRQVLEGWHNAFKTPPGDRFALKTAAALTGLARSKVEPAIRG